MLQNRTRAEPFGAIAYDTQSDRFTLASGSPLEEPIGEIWKRHPYRFVRDCQGLLRST